MQPRQEVMLNAITATTTSGGFAINNASRLSIQVKAASITSGNCVFTIQVSNDGTNWTAYNRIVSNVTNTNAQTDTKVASVTLSSNGTAMLFFPDNDTFAFIRIIGTVTTDGTYQAVGYFN